MARFVDRLDILLDEKKYKKSRLAKKLGLAPSTVFRWYERNSTPAMGTLLQICEIFDCDLDWLRGVEKEREHFRYSSLVEPEEIKEDELDEELVRLIRGLTPAQVQRVRDFLSGLRG